MQKNLTIDELHEKLSQFPLILLESQLDKHPSSRCSYIAANPKSSITVYGSTIDIVENGEKRTVKMNPWKALREFRNEKKRWLFGYLGYDLKNHVEELESTNLPLTDTPDMYFMEPELLLKMESGEIEVLRGDFDLPENSKSGLPGSVEMKLKPLIGKEEYIETVQTIQKKIQQGDFYEMNYTIPLCGGYMGNPYWLYSRMREISPVPFGAFISHDEFSVCCASRKIFEERGELYSLRTDQRNSRSIHGFRNG